jgi:putative DNA primase/helicase
MRERYPSATLVVLADLGNGNGHAEQAARTSGALLALPRFGADRPECATDFNDMATLCDLGAVAQAIADAAAPDATAQATEGIVWAEPRPLPPELHPVQPFDLALLPDSLRPWIADVCERVQCPADFVAVPVMVALGTLIGRKVRIRPKARDSWTVVPNVWGCIIGRPGTMKSPAVAEAVHPLRRLEAKAREEYEALHANYETQAELAKLRREAAKDKARATLKKPGGEVSAEALWVEQPDEPIQRRYTAHQSSVQALGELLRQNPNGLMVERDELAALLSFLSQEEQAEARGFYLTGADGIAGYNFDTIGRGLNLRVPAVCLSIIGTSQPGKIGRYLRQAQSGGEGDDGMMQRFGLMVWPDAPREWHNVDRWPDTEARLRAFAIFEQLDALTAESVGTEKDDDCAFLRFAPDALEAFTEWRSHLETRLRSGEWHPALESHFAKYRKTIPALALLLHVADDGAGQVTLKATLRALSWADYLESHALRCYGATVAGEIAGSRRILARIRKGELVDGFKAREIDRTGWSELTDRETVRAALGLLVAHGYLAEDELPPTAMGGRPTLAYRIHPASMPA